LSNQIYELEKKDSLARATEPNGFGLKDESNIADKKLLVDLIVKDSIHAYTDRDVITLSNYIRELEKRDSLSKIKAEMKAAAAAAEAAKPQVKEVHLEEEAQIKDFAKQIFFSTNSASLTEDSYKPLDDILKILSSYINLNFIIEGYTDNVGTNEYNLLLSKRRAKTIREYFISKGIPAARITSATGYGKAKPVGSNDTEEGKALNRRVEIKAIH
jgi:outer membrane protein OmpA-like peptidoglycan-associated protein